MIYVFEVHIRPGYSADEYARAWVAASTIIQRSPGALGTRLHRSLEDDSKLIAIASWESKAARDRSDQLVADEVTSIIASQAPFVDIRMLGEFADPEWIVDPE